MTGPSAPPAALTARRLLRSLDRASLATSLPASLGGGPYASLVLVATAPDGSPLLLVSDLAQHAINIATEPRIALLFDGTAGLPGPLARPRRTGVGRARSERGE